MIFKELIICLVLFSPIFSKSLSITEGMKDTVWSPQNVSREDWIRCNCMPCEQWERTKPKQMRLKILASSQDQDNLDKVLDLDVLDINDTALHQDDFDGCIWLDESQIDNIFKQKQENLFRRKKRKISKFAVLNKWTSPIHWKFDGSHTSYERQQIKDAIRHVEAQTCMEFKEIDLFQEFTDNHIIFTKALTGCHSYVGKVNIIPQAINLQAGCIRWYGIIVHEIGHALGLWHEQQREDRDDHINVLWNNLGGYQGQFYKARNQDTLGVGYDVGSVMHYGPKDGSKDNSNVMETKDPLYQHNMGQRVGFSFNDAKIINRAYCENKCSQPLDKPCQHGGYQDPNACQQCRCAPGFGGTYCDQVATSVGNCGGEMNLDNNSGAQYITSPGYKSQKYDNHLTCNWLIKAPANTQIRLSFEDTFRVFCQYQQQCFHWVEVKYKNGLEKQGPRFCCYQTPSVQLTSDDNEMAVIFRSNFTANSFYRDGFKAKIELVGTGPTNSPSSTKKTTTSSTTLTAASTTTTKTTTTTKPTTTTPELPDDGECVRIDLAFILDSSGSVTQNGWKSSLQYVTKTIQKLKYSEECAKFAVISVGNRGYPNIRLNNQLTKSRLLEEISMLRFRDEWTNTGSAFEVLLSDIYGTRNGVRDSAERIAVLVTDGKANSGPNVLSAAKNARESGIKIIGIGIGNEVDRNELSAITNEPSCLRYAAFSDIVQEGFVNNVLLKMKDLIDMNSGPTEKFSYSCRFEDEMNNGEWCGITQAKDDDFDWTLKSGGTPSQLTGPKAAYNGNYYIYIEASSPRKNNDSAVIELPPVKVQQIYCLRFHYHMFGYHINHLAVLTKSSSGNTMQQWRLEREQGNEWKEAKIEFHMNSGDKVLFKAARGQEYSGDIALDNVILTSC